MTERDIKAVLSDVDDTLIIPHTTGLPTPAVSEAARRLRNNGKYLSAVTARSHHLLSRVAPSLYLGNNLCALDGGATVAHAESGEVVWSQWLSVESRHSVIASIGPLCTRVSFDQASWNIPPREVLAHLDSDTFPLMGAAAIFAVFERSEGDQILAALADVPDIQHTPVMTYGRRPGMACLQVHALGVDKQHGAEKTLELAGLADERVLAIGDGTNDAALFAAVGPDGVKVAMGNASDELKDLADWVAPPVEQDGFAVAMEHYGLI